MGRAGDGVRCYVHASEGPNDPNARVPILVGAGIQEPRGADEAIRTGLLYLGARSHARLVVRVWWGKEGRRLRVRRRVVMDHELAGRWSGVWTPVATLAAGWYVLLSAALQPRTVRPLFWVAA